MRQDILLVGRPGHVEVRRRPDDRRALCGGPYLGRPGPGPGLPGRSPARDPGSCIRCAAFRSGDPRRDGTRDGYDLELIRTIADRVTVPVVASGGVGNLQHLVEGISQGHASAVLAASIFHFGEASIADAHAALESRLAVAKTLLRP